MLARVNGVYLVHWWQKVFLMEIAAHKATSWLMGHG